MLLLQTFIIILLLSGNAFAWTPDEIGVEVAARSPNQGEVTDYLLGLDCEMYSMSGHVEWERENGVEYINYKVTGSKDAGDWEYDFSTRASEARDINTQKITCKRRLGYIGLGIGLTAEDYNTDRLHGVCVYSMPLYRYGSLNYMTNFGGLEIWDVNVSISEADKKVSPAITGRFYRQIGKPVDWAVSIGVKIKFTE